MTTQAMVQGIFTTVLTHPNEKAGITIIGPCESCYWHDDPTADIVYRLYTGTGTSTSTSSDSEAVKIIRIRPDEQGNPLLAKFKQATAEPAQKGEMTIKDVVVFNNHRGMQPTHVLVEHGNTTDPSRFGWENTILTGYGHSQADAIREQRAWLKSKLLGEPVSDYEKSYPVEKMKANGMVSIWDIIPVEQYDGYVERMLAIDAAVAHTNGRRILPITGTPIIGATPILTRR